MKKEEKKEWYNDSAYHPKTGLKYNESLSDP